MHSQSPFCRHSSWAIAYHVFSANCLDATDRPIHLIRSRKLTLLTFKEKQVFHSWHCWQVQQISATSLGPVETASVIPASNTSNPTQLDSTQSTDKSGRRTRFIM